jgi:hypothetical protein
MSSILATLARQSLAQFVIVYTEIYDGSAIPPEELDALMWARMCAKEANIAPVGFKIPFDNIRRATVTLPYLPDLINYTGCCAIKKNGGLYTPCCGKTLPESTYCKTCSVDKEGEFKELEFGDIEDRDTNVEEEVFAPISFGEWMKGHKTTLPEVYEKLRAAGVPIEIPARELSVRELPKRRKGRPTRSEDSVEDEDSPKAKKASKKASGSESDAPKAKKASKKAAASDDEAPKKASKAKKAAASDDEAPKKAPKVPKKASKADASDDEAPKKAKKASKVDASESETEKPKAKKASKVDASESETEKPKAKKASKAESDSGSEDSDAKAARKAAKKAAKAAAAEAAEAEAEAAAKKAKKAKKAKEAAEAAAKEAAAKEAAELEVEEEEEEIEGDYEQDCEIDGKDYNLRNGKIICDKENGEILGSLDENGDPVWNSEKR